MFLLVLAAGVWMLLAVCALVLATKRSRAAWKQLCISFFFALFFSISFAGDHRIILPLPTFVVVPLWVHDEIEWRRNPPPCRPAGEGCLEPPRGEAIFVAPFLVQWLGWLLLLVTVSYLRSRGGLLRKNTNEEQRVAV